ncbi:hypothetical protein CO731_04843 [Aminobacter sp. MSH1]|uniref:hypothetical protein n=1 Tax=Aminobacter sp. MSH1 TaxID=374606 RepID=UPI000D389466|nr:hypothetical protein [Aminobacter sp. MSH1]AWC25348.1 hypothetical protein CO731_04843 [Aminobacter sp. MSH1]
MSTETDTRDRVIRLEAEVGALTKQVASMDSKVTEMHGLLLQAKGVRWFIISAAAIGGFLAVKAASLIPWLTSIPPK